MLLMNMNYCTSDCVTEGMEKAELGFCCFQRLRMNVVLCLVCSPKYHSCNSERKSWFIDSVINFNHIVGKLFVQYILHKKCIAPAFKEHISKRDWWYLHAFLTLKNYFCATLILQCLTSTVCSDGLKLYSLR